MANDLNQYQAIGRLGQDPETRAVGETSVCNFSIAVGKSWKNKAGEVQEKTLWVRCSAWGKLGEICQRYLTKGKQVYISGELNMDKFNDSKTGQERESVQIELRDMKMLGSKDDSAPSGQPAPQRSQQGTPPASGGGFDDDIPFAPYMHKQVI